MLRNSYEMSADANNYGLQNEECQRLLPSREFPSRSPRFAKRVARSVGDLTTHAIFGLRLDDVIVLS